MTKIINFSNRNIAKISQIINKSGGLVRLVGGCVRDKILGIDTSDYDLATDLKPGKIMRIFEEENIQVIPTGIKHGTVTVIIDKTHFEITTLRQDIENFGRHAKVEFTDDFRKDAERRDFTINALSYDLKENKIYDYFNGINDLENQIVKFIGSPDERIQEDYLRILRFFRFSAYYAKKTDKEGLLACNKHSKGLSNISIERIKNELSKIFICRKNLKNIFIQLEESLILKNIPLGYEIDITGICNFEDKFENLYTYSNDILSLRLAFLLFACGTEYSKEFLKENKFSNSEISKTLNLIKFIEKIVDKEDKQKIYYEICRIWYFNKSEINNHLLALLILDKIDSDSFKYNFEIMQNDAPKKPFTSKDIANEGFSGLALGNRIKHLENKWIESGFSITKDELINFKEIENASKSKKA